MANTNISPAAIDVSAVVQSSLIALANPGKSVIVACDCVCLPAESDVTVVLKRSAVKYPEDVVTAPVGAIIITEIMKNQEAVTDGEGERIEVYNASDENIDLQGWTLGDAKNDNNENES